MVTPGSVLFWATSSRTWGGSGRKEGPLPVSKSSPPGPPEIMRHTFNIAYRFCHIQFVQADC